MLLGGLSKMSPTSSVMIAIAGVKEVSARRNAVECYYVPLAKQKGVVMRVMCAKYWVFLGLV